MSVSLSVSGSNHTNPLLQEHISLVGRGQGEIRPPGGKQTPLLPAEVDSGGTGGNRDSEGDNTAPLGGQGGEGSKIRVRGGQRMRWDRGLGDNEGAAPGDEGRRDLGHQQTHQEQQEEEVVGVWDYSTEHHCLLGLIPGEPDLGGGNLKRGDLREAECGSREAGSYEEEPRTGAEVLGEYTSSCSHTPCCFCFNTRTRVKYHCPDFTG